MQTFRLAHAPRQQYGSLFSRAQAEMHPTCLPWAFTRRTLGQSTGFVQPFVEHPLAEIGSFVFPWTMLIHIGRFDPSTMLTSEKSRWSNESRLYSASVAGIPPYPRH